MSVVIEAKKKFLDRYNIDRSNTDALSKSISAAVQHNKLYKSGLAESSRKEIRAYWGECLKEIQKTVENLTDEDYEKKILELQEKMNSKFGDLFYNPEGFKISHSQKSISVYLKHMWCLEEIGKPNQCPIDSIVLKKIGKKYPYTKWTTVNDIEIHRNQIKDVRDFIIEKFGNETSLAEGELLLFQSDEN
ncbi:MAG: hypothetical protein PQJ61_14215 [Spirochaetales bacterium]|uniref:Uncharacterized protein n=1 Tax=Candidatus Thalassospirochaeta sargassi TaxID=3119039 RepID=A0AAJ1IEM2_9SPIO|nr:hypothetical protein [Spirochaetales bacterium]